MRNIENGRIRIAVDRDDTVGLAHPGHMLDLSGNPHSDVELGTHRCTGLSDLMILADDPGVNRGTGGTDFSAEHVRQLLEQGKILFGSHAHTAGNDNGKRP